MAGRAMTELTIDQALQQGIEAHQAGQVQEADRLYTAILKAQPKHPDANHNMGVLAVGVGKVEQALPFFKTALEANANTAQFWLSYIDTLIKLDRLADAKAVLDQAKSKGAKGDGFDKQEQRLQEASRGPALASKLASEPQPRQPNILDSLKLDQAISLAKKEFKAGSPEEAKRIYQDILTKFPKNKRASDGLKRLVGRPVGKAFKVQEPPQAQTQELVKLYSQGQLQQALKQAETLVMQFPRSAVLFNIQGAVLKGLEQLEASVEAYNKALAIKPDFAEANNNMGVTLKEQGKLAEAIEAYNKAIAIKPDYADPYNNMGSALKDQGKLEEAIEAYNKALAIKPDFAEAARNLVRLPIGSIDEKSISKLNKRFSFLCSKIEDASQRLFFEANTLTHNGKYDDAFEAFVEANRIKSDEVAASVKNEIQRNDILLKRIQRWSPHLQRHSNSLVKQLFLLGPSRSGKSSLEKLMMGIPKVYPMSEGINFNLLNEMVNGNWKHQNLDMKQIFYHDENVLLNAEKSLVTSTFPESLFYIDRLLDGFVNSFCILVKRDQKDLACEIFNKEYTNGHFYSYDHSSIQKYLDTYAEIWEEVKLKAPHRALELEFEDVLTKPQEVLMRISKFTNMNLRSNNAQQSSTKKRISPFRDLYAQKFEPYIN